MSAESESIGNGTMATTGTQGSKGVVGPESILQHFEDMPYLQLGSNRFILDVKEVEEIELLERARTELRETPENVEAGYRRMRELVKDYPDLVLPPEDLHYKLFLRMCKWYPESAMKRILNYYRFRKTHPKIYTNFLPSNARCGFISGVLLPLPLRPKSGERVLIINAGTKWVPKNAPVEEIFKGIIIISEGAEREPHTQVCGFQVILNMDGFSIGHIPHISPSFAAMAVDWLQNSMVGRVKAVHIVNQPFIFNVAFAIFKPFLQEKLRNRIYFHGTTRSKLFEMIEAEVLPTWIGGKADIPQDGFEEDLYEYVSKFDELFRVGNQFGFV